MNFIKNRYIKHIVLNIISLKMVNTFSYNHRIITVDIIYIFRINLY